MCDTLILCAYECKTVAYNSFLLCFFHHFNTVFVLPLHLNCVLWPWLSAIRKHKQGRMLSLCMTSLPHRRQSLLNAYSSPPYKRVMHSAFPFSSPSVLSRICRINAECTLLISRDSRQELVSMFDLHTEIGMSHSEPAETAHYRGVWESAVSWSTCGVACKACFGAATTGQKSFDKFPLPTTTTEIRPCLNQHKWWVSKARDLSTKGEISY